MLPANVENLTYPCLRRKATHPDPTTVEYSTIKWNGKYKWNEQNLNNSGGNIISAIF